MRDGGDGYMIRFVGAIVPDEEMTICRGVPDKNIVNLSESVHSIIIYNTLMTAMSVFSFDEGSRV